MEEDLWFFLLIFLVYSFLSIGVFTLLLVILEDDKISHIRHSAKGIKNIINDCGYQNVDLSYLANQIQLFYEQYVQEKPSAKKYFNNSIVWLDAIIVRVNMGKVIVKVLKTDYVVLSSVRDYLNNEMPYSNCSEYQQDILKDIEKMETNENHVAINNILNRTKNEFVRLGQDIKKNEKSNKISIAIGVVGIVVSIVLTYMNF